MARAKVLIVDDSAFMRRVISDIIGRHPDLEVIGTARNGQEALAKIRDLKPDVVTMDVEMPVMDGLQALETIMREDPLPVVMLSSLTQAGADATMRALQLGAVDFVPKPSGTISLDIEKVADVIIQKTRIAAGTRINLRKVVAPVPVFTRTEPTAPVPKPIGGSGLLEKLVVIGTSTGGPKALHEVIPNLPAHLPAGVLVVQHMPPGFTRSLAERLNSMSAVEVKEAEHGDTVLPGHVYIAPGDFHLKVRRCTDGTGKRLVVNLTKDPLESGHRPSVDAMFDSAVAEFWAPMVGVIMTGMGADGARAAVGIKQKGGKIIAEDKSTCIVYGMPKAVVDSGNADKVVPLNLIASEIVRAL
ncbi:MAG: protein-glutamate methylesterase/protein-glutamine glutaminase [Solirubrobacterales bacterium]